MLRTRKRQAVEKIIVTTKQNNMPTAKKPKADVEILSFYGGKVKLEKKPWGDHFRVTRIDEDGSRHSIISVTRVIKRLDKSQPLIIWAVGLTCGYVRSKIELSKATSFTKEEIFSLVNEASTKYTEAKESGGTVGGKIHDFAEAFAKSKVENTIPPELKHFTLPDAEENRKVMNGINAFLDWYNEEDVEFLKMEDILYYNSFYAGDTKEGEIVVEFWGIRDLFARVNGVLTNVDYKTGKAIYTDQRYQLSAYNKSHNTNMPDNKGSEAQQGLILNFNKETGELVKGYFTPEEMELDFTFGFCGLYFTSAREEALEKERLAKKK